MGTNMKVQQVKISLHNSVTDFETIDEETPTDLSRVFALTAAHSKPIGAYDHVYHVILHKLRSE